MRILSIILFTCFNSLYCVGDSTQVFPWKKGFPNIRTGAQSVDLFIQLELSAQIYYVFLKEDLTNCTPEVVKNIALRNHNRKDLVVMKSGVIKYSSGNVGASLTYPIHGLNPNSVYSLYLVVEWIDINKGIMLSNNSIIPVKTKYRQQTMSFNSITENREVFFFAYQTEVSLKYPEFRYPVLVFLGGNGEVSTQGEMNLLRNGTLPEYISRKNDVPMLVISPQHIKNHWNINMIDEMVEVAKERFPVDSQRVYMTGISGGAIATWNYCAKYSMKIAAIVPISGSGKTSKACNLIDLPIWAFHNQVDGIVPSAGSVNMINAINECKPTEKKKLTVFEDSGHNAWKRVYNIKHPDWKKTAQTPINIYSWLLQFKK